VFDLEDGRPGAIQERRLEIRRSDANQKLEQLSEQLNQLRQQVDELRKAQPKD
jgi:hypothetical protein